MNLIDKKKSKVEEMMRSEICAATCRLISGTTLYEMKMSDIAEEAGVSKGTLYNYFSSKEDLVLTIIADINKRASAFFDPILEDASLSARERLIKYLRAHFEFAETHRSWLLLFVGAEKEFPVLSEQRKQHIDRKRAVFLSLFKDGIEKEGWIVDNPETRAWMIGLIIMELIMELICNPENSPGSDEVIDVLVNSINLGIKDNN
jgi:AcrR family transcriptional regulator